MEDIPSGRKFLLLVIPKKEENLGGGVDTLVHLEKKKIGGLRDIKGEQGLE